MKDFSDFLRTFSLALLVSLVSMAQVKNVGEPVLLIPATNHPWVNPKWSPDGNLIAFSAEGFKGLWIAKADGSEIRSISSEEGVGFGFSWAPDSKSILVRSSEYRGNSRFQSVKLVDLLTLETETLIEPTRGIRSLPVWLENSSTIVTVVNDLPVVNEVGRNPGLEKRHSFIFPIGSKFFRQRNGQKDTDPVVDFENRNIFNIRFSPSGNKVAFQIAAKGLFAMNVDGSNLVNLGFYERPSWVPDEEHLVVMKTHDDGYTFISGQLYAIDLTSGKEEYITGGAHIIALTPDVSPCGNFVLFEDFKTGGIYVVQIK